MKLGRVVATRGFVSFAEEHNIDALTIISRHLSHDWGDLDAEDKRLNDHAVKSGGRVLSAYKVTPDQKVWVITEADRSVTTLLLPEEY